MPSGPKKRARARRKKAGSPSATTDANSDRETEALSVTGSMDVDDLESGLDTPKASVRPSFLDRATLSSQTDEWVRVSNFDVGTPTSQTGEDGDASGISRRSLDRLAEWETVSGEQIPERGQEWSIDSLEEEPSEVEAASGHSSESFTHLPSAAKDHSSDSIVKAQKRGKNVPTSRSSSSSFSSSEKSALASADIGEEVSSVPPAAPGKEAKRSSQDPIEEEVVVHEAVSSEDTLASDDPSHPVEELITRSSLKNISEVDSPLSIVPGPEESAAQEDKVVLPIQAEEVGGDKQSSSSVVTEGSEGSNLEDEEKRSHSSVVNERSGWANKEEGNGKILYSSVNEGDGKMSYSSVVMALGPEEKAPTSSSPVGVEDNQVDADEKACPAIGEDEEVEGAASTSLDAEKGEKSKDFEVGTLVEKNSSNVEELGAHSGSEKAVITSATSGSVDAPASAAQGEKNGQTEKTLLEVKPHSTGCCGAIYGLFGWDH